MAKNSKKDKKAEETTQNDHLGAYFKDLHITDLKCFKGENIIHFTQADGKLAQWTVILGNNNTGKTTILKCLSNLCVLKDEEDNTPFKKANHVQIFCPRGGMDSIFFNNLKKSCVFGSTIQYISSKTKEVISEIGWNNWAVFLLEGMTPSEVENPEPMSIISAIESQEQWVKNLLAFPYGTQRRMTDKTEENENDDSHANFLYNTPLRNIEEWILRLDYVSKNGQEDAKKILDIIKDVLTSGILPDVTDYEIKSEQTGKARFATYLLFHTDYGKVRLKDLGFGYQSMMAWVLDLVRRMIERYPDAVNPLAEPNIVLVDEIDLHLHPEWQRKIVGHLSKYFPNTQFIVTAHSPLVVQSADSVNVVLLKKEAGSDHVTIEQPRIQTFKGWSVEDILSDLMGMGERTMSDEYIRLMEKFEKGLDTDDYDLAKSAYDELVPILSPMSAGKKLLELQMTALTPVEA